MALTLTTSPATIQLAKNPVFVKFLSTSYSSLDNYRVVLRVLFESTYKSGTYTEIVETEAIPNANGETIFDLSGVLATAMERAMTFQVPNVTGLVPYVADTLRRFKIEYLEKYGTPQVEQTPTTSAAYKVLYGGVDAHYFALNNFFSELSSTNALLTYYPSGKIISSDQPEYITYIQHAAATLPHAFVRVVEYDSGGNWLGTKDLYRLNADYPDPIYLDRYQAAVFPTGPDAIFMDADTAKYTVQVFTVEAVDTGSLFVESGSAAAASQQYTYYVNNDIQVSPQTIIWFNGFLAPHILRCTGKKATRLDVQRGISEKNLGLDYDPTINSIFQHNRDWNNNFSYRSGSLKPAEKDALQELLIENILLEYAADGNYYRLLLTGGGYAILETESSPNYLEFTAVRALAPRNYMRLSSTAVSAPTEQGWLVSDNGFWELGVAGGYWQL